MRTDKIHFRKPYKGFQIWKNVTQAFFFVEGYDAKFATHGEAKHYIRNNLLKPNEKAPDALAGDHGANEINQVQDKPDFGNCQEPVDPVIPELIAITKRLHELRDKGIIFSIDNAASRVHVPSNKFPGLFGFGEWDGEGHAPEFDVYSTTVQGVEFFCLVEKEEERNA